MRKQYSTNDLKVGETAMVDMSITYSHIVKAYDASEIERKIASDTQAGRIAPDRNDAGRLREITGCDVNIHNASETFKKFLDERCYTSRKKTGSYFANLRTNFRPALQQETLRIQMYFTSSYLKVNLTTISMLHLCSMFIARKTAQTTASAFRW